MAEPNAPSSTALVPSNTSATKRSSNGDTSPDKRQKTTQQNDKQPIYDLNTVILKWHGIFVTQVPLYTFRTFASEKLRDLVEISGSDTQGWRFYTYDVSVASSTCDVQRWARWLEHWDVRAVVRGGPQDGLDIHFALVDANRIGDVHYQDALVDAWMVWLRAKNLKNSLDVNRLRYKVFGLLIASQYHDCLRDLGRALILYHDTRAGMAETTGRWHHYDAFSRKAIRELAQKYFSEPEREPKDPLQLSADEFCQKYHSHHNQNLPCYRTKKLPEQTPSD